MERIYSQEILELAAALRSGERLEAPDATVRRTARICGSVVEVDVCVKGDVVTGFGQEVNACALGQASASILAANVLGAGVAEIRTVRDQVAAMLTEGAPPPEGRWADYRFLLPVRDYPARHGSTLLALNATVECLENIAQARAGAHGS
ncbi:MAG TPA: iron-sulfur cluster assembly scaffold protein [Devosia sp.]|nr:iron-sulfur cluster assembly scaffold protein [Devosia sp.]